MVSFYLDINVHSSSLGKSTPFFRKFSCQRLISEFSEEFEKQISKFFCLSLTNIWETTKKCQITPFRLTISQRLKVTKNVRKLQHQIILFCKPKRVFPCWAFKLIPKVNNIKMSFFANQMESFQSHVEHQNWYFFILEKIARNR